MPEDSAPESQGSSSPIAPSCWLMKAEPDSRIVNGKDVKFSVDDFESASTTAWEGVRNAEARNLMKQMKIGDEVLFYHSNCKNPGIVAFAEVVKEAYPDHTAWDTSHPYFDAKTDKEKPKWFMVDVKFGRRTVHFVSLALLKRIASDSYDDISYLENGDIEAIKGMALINRGRLSVQRVERVAWDAIEKLGERGGWGESVKKVKGASSRSTKRKKKPRRGEASEDRDEEDEPEETMTAEPELEGRKRKLQDVDAVNTTSRRRPRRANGRE